MDNCARVHMLAAFFRMEPDELRKIASSLAEKDQGKYGSRTHVTNLFSREAKPRKGAVNKTTGLSVGARFEANGKQVALFRDLTKNLCKQRKIRYLAGLSLDSKPEAFLKAIDTRLDQEEVLSTFHPSQRAAVEYYSNLAVADALGLPHEMRINRTELGKKVSPWEGKYAVYRLSSTRIDEIELSEELLEIEMGDTATCRFFGHGGGQYEGVLVYSDQAFSCTLSHASSKIDSHVYFFLSMSTLAVKARSVFFGTLTMRSDYNDLRFYQVLLVRKPDDFEPRGRDIQDPEILLKAFPVLSQTERTCERHEGPYKNEALLHPVFATNRNVVGELLRRGDELSEAYQSNQEEFPEEFTNFDILMKAEELLIKS